MSDKKTIVITGASDGIGAAAARQLHRDGFQVVLVGRSLKKTQTLATELGTPYYIADFAVLDDVRKLTKKLQTDLGHINILANNAGAIMGDRETTVDGFEKTFQVNHLAPFLLTNLLLPKLIESKASIINTSSVAHRLFSKLDIDDLNLEHDYTVSRAYGNAKLANVLFTKELATRFGEYGITTASFHPGNVATHFAADSTSRFRFVYKTFLKNILLISPEKGADTLVWLATTQPDKDWKSGEYYEKRKPGKTHELAGDKNIARELWDRSELMVDKFKTK